MFDSGCQRVAGRAASVDRSYHVSNPDRSAFDDVGAQARVDQAFQHGDLCTDHAGEVIAGLASFLAYALDLSHAKPLADELTEVDASDDDLAPRVARLQVERVLGVLALDRLGLEQRDVARLRVVEVAITLEPAPGMRDDGLHGVCRLAVLLRQVYRLDPTLVVAHLARKC